MKPPRGLRARMAALAVGTAALVIVLAAVPLTVLLGRDARSDARHAAEVAAESAADFLSRGSGQDRLVGEYLERLHRRTGARVTVLRPGAPPIGASLSTATIRSLGALPTPAHDGDNDRDDLGSVSEPRQLDVGHDLFVHVTVQDPVGVVRVVARVGDATTAAMGRRYLFLVLAALALLALAWAAAVITAGRLARPLQRAAATAAALGAGDLAARVEPEGPDEVVAVARELNALADRIGELLQLERETAADLSHRLRTPLTALRLVVERLPAGAAADEVEQHVASLERALTQVIRSARRGLREGLRPRSDVAAVVRDRFAFWQPLAVDQGREASVMTPTTPLWVKSSSEDLAGALDALLENVFAHTPEGAGFAVEVVEREGSAVVAVMDGGPGIPAGADERGRSARASTGLGLDIARRIAEASGGALEVIRGGDAPGVRLHLGLDEVGAASGG